MTEIAARAAQYRNYVRPAREKKPSQVRKQICLAEIVIRQAGISILALLLIFLLKGIDTPATKFAVEQLKWLTVSHTNIDGIYESVDHVISELGELRLPFASQQSAAEKWFDDDMNAAGGCGGNSNDPYGLYAASFTGVPDETANRYLDPEFAVNPISDASSQLRLPIPSRTPSVFADDAKQDGSAAAAMSSITYHGGLSYYNPDQGNGVSLNDMTVIAPAGTGSAKASAKESSAASKVVLRIPLYGAVTSFFGPRNHPILKRVEFHNGIDIGGKKGEPIKACSSGNVSEAGWGGGYGNYVLIDHGSGFSTLYAHCSSLLVKKGDSVKTGTIIGKVGSTGLSTGPHLHLEVRINGKPADPLVYLDFN